MTRKKIWDNYREVAEVRKSDGIKFVIAAATRNGFRYVNIREFYLRKKDNIWRPGRDGVTIPVIMPLNKGESFIRPVLDMLQAVTDASMEAEAMALEDELNAVWYEKD